MKKQEKIIEGAVKRIAKKIVDLEVYGWPPQCGTIYYQPVRPPKEEREKSTENQYIYKKTLEQYSE